MVVMMSLWVFCYLSMKDGVFYSTILIMCNRATDILDLDRVVQVARSCLLIGNAESTWPFELFVVPSQKRAIYPSRNEYKAYRKAGLL
jgi:hypothetical protein